MEQTTNKTLRMDWHTRTCLTAITVLLTLLVIGLWADRSDSLTQTATAGTTSSRFQDEKAKKAFQQGRWGTSSAEGKFAAVQSDTNKKIDQLIGLLKSGDAQIQVVGTVKVKSEDTNAQE